MAVSALVFSMWVTLPEWTMDRFLNLVRDGEMEAARAMLAPHPSNDHDNWLLDEHTLTVAVEHGLYESHQRTLLDILEGRCHISAQLVYANDHSITVEQGGVVLGGSFYIFYLPGPPDRLPPSRRPDESP